MTGIRPHHTEIEVVVKLGPTATVETTETDNMPVIELRWGSITVVIMPRTVADDEPIAACDVDRAHDLHTATTQYLHATQALWQRQQATATQDLNQHTTHPPGGDHD